MALENLQMVTADGSRAGQRIVSMKGPLSIHTVFEFQNVVRAETSPNVIIDFTGVPYIDSAGLGALVGAHLSAQKSRRKILLVAMNTQAITLLEMTRIRSMFAIYPTLQEAEAAPL
ncbi:MAG TPA: STAS domain-containing protein [Candidatus Cybelea sp.]|jgi:anti-sigma B factor antagonist|nr:STAS domain-containing protein [Candidatus Cybelea sp.]